MSDVRPYVPGQTGSLSDVIERAPELAPVTPAGPGGFAPPPTSGELFSAYRTQNRSARTDFDEIMLRDGYSPIVDALGLGQSQNPAAFYSRDVGHDPVMMRSDLLARQGGGFMGSMTDRETQESLIAGEIKARRAQDPKFLPDVPDTVDGLHAWFVANEARKRQASGATIARGQGGLTQSLIGLAGGGFESFHDPVNLLTLPIGGGGKTAVQVVAREALLNGVLEAAQLPVAAHNVAELGEHMTAGEAIQDVVGAGVFGGILGGTIHIAGEHVPPALFKVLPESVQQRWADRMKVGGGKDAPLLKDLLGDMDNRELAGFARSTIGERMTPDERAAADTLEREQELGEASPFMPGPAGDAAHNSSLASSLQAIIDGAPRPAPTRGDLLGSTSLNPAAVSRPIDVGRASVPHDIVDFFKAKGLDDAHAYGIAAGIMAESGGDHTVINPKSGASFLGQWLGSRLEAIKARYGPNPTRQEQLEFLWHELNGGDPGGKHVLAAGDAGSVLDAYVRKFMRPAAGFETDRDLRAGMDALGHKGELPEGSAIAPEGDDLATAAEREAADADREGLELAQQDPDAELARSAGADALEIPVLKRELFASDLDWAQAQIEFAASLRRENGPQEPGNGPPGHETGSRAPNIAVDASGAPVRVYRGEHGAGFNGELQSRLGSISFTADRRVAGTYANSPNNRELDKVAAEPRILQAELEIRNPVLNDPDDPFIDLQRIRETLGEQAARDAAREFAGSIENTGNWMDEINADDRYFSVAEFLEQNPDGLNQLYFDAFELFDDPAWVERFKAAGFDGAIHGGNGESALTAEYKIFDPSQARLVDPQLDRVRIDEPELKAFDEPSSPGRKDQVESLEHDARMLAEERASEHLERRFAELGPQPKKPGNFMQSVAGILREKSKRAGLRYRISAEDAISHGVEADQIYIDPQARYPVVKLQYQGIFAATRAPLRSKAVPTKIVHLDWLGDRVDPQAFGVHREGGDARLEPHEAGELLQASIDKSDHALNRSDPAYEEYFVWWRAHDQLGRLEGEPAHPITGETLPEAQHRAEFLRQSFPASSREGTPGTHNIANSAPAPEGGTRGELRAKIYAMLMAKPARADREAHIVLGPPAAGKSTFADPLVAATGSRLIDADEAKTLLPEFEDGIGTAAVHEESSRIAAVAAEASIRNGDNIVLPLVGRTHAGVAARIRDLVDAGYTVHVHLVDLPGEKAVDRAIARFQETGRLVDPDYVRSVGDRPRETFARILDEYKGKLGGHVHVSNDVELGKPPRLVEASSQELAARLGYDRPGGAGKGAEAAQGGSEGAAGAAARESVSELDAGRRYQLDEHSDAKTLAEILEDLDRDQQAVDALRACTVPVAAAA